MVIVDDHPAFRLGLRVILDTARELSVCGEAHDFASAREVIRRERPDMAVIDLMLGDANGLDLVRELGPSTPALVLSMHDEELDAERALQAGARRFLSKNAQPERIVQGVRDALANRLVFSAGATQQLLLRRAGADTDPLALLSDRQLHVYELLGRGRSTQEIASSLHISMKTVETHVANIKRRLAITSLSKLRADAAVRVHKT